MLLIETLMTIALVVCMIVVASVGFGYVLDAIEEGDFSLHDMDDDASGDD